MTKKTNNELSQKYSFGFRQLQTLFEAAQNSNSRRPYVLQQMFIYFLFNSP